MGDSGAAVVFGEQRVSAAGGKIVFDVATVGSGWIYVLLVVMSYDGRLSDRDRSHELKLEREFAIGELRRNATSRTARNIAVKPDR